jgi:Tol biopolymer transport system component
MTRIGTGWLSIVVAALALSSGTTAQQQKPISPDTLMGQALHQEEVEGDLETAIATYKKVIADPQANRGLKATALLHIGRAYERLGSVEARKAYEQLTREYADQAEIATQARSRLLALGGAVANHDSQVVARQIWVGEAVDLEGRPSGDGRFLTFIDWRSTNTGNVAIRDLATGETHRITNASAAEGYAYEPSPSPDGKSIAYVWDGEGVTSVRTIRIDGSRPRVLSQQKGLGAYYLRWSPDGRHLAASFIDFAGDRTWRIVLVATADGSITRLKSTGWQEPIIGGFSPDGRFLVYAFSKLSAGPEAGIFSIAVDGARESAIVHGTATDTSPAWTNDGRAVVFLSDRSGTQDLWSIRVVDGQPQGEPVLVRSNMGDIVNMGFTRDGSYYYGAWNQKRDVYIADRDPQTLRLVAPPARLSDQYIGSNAGPAWSPDGLSIAFVRGADRHGRTIVIRSLITGAERTLPIKLSDGYWVWAFGPTWLPDSQSILVVDADWAKRRMILRRVNVNSSQEHTVLDEEIGRIYPPMRVSPDGRWLYFSRSEPSASPEQVVLRLIKKELESGEETELFRAESPGVGFFGLAVSPSGDRLSYMMNVGLKDERHVMVMPTAGGEARILYRGDYSHPTPFAGVWTRDGKYVLGVAEEAKKIRRLWAFPAEGGDPQKLDILPQTISTVDLSPDGRRMVFTGIQEKGEVWSIRNLIPQPAVTKPSTR